MPSNGDKRLSFMILAGERVAVINARVRPKLTIGHRGIQGEQGIQGFSAYDVAVQNGFVGTKAEWLASLNGVNWRGTWASGTTYKVNDGVFHNGASFRRLVAGAGTTNPALDPTNWHPVALKGDTGATGATGAPGTPGSGTVNLPELTRNLIKNPRAAVDLALLNGGDYNSTPVRSTDWPAGGTSMKLPVDSVAVDTTAYMEVESGFLMMYGLLPGHTYTVSGLVNPVTASGVISFVSLTPTVGYLIRDVVVPRGASSQRISLSFAVPHNANEAWVRLESREAVADGDYAYFTDLMLTEGPDLLDYFDGDTYGCTWTGTPHASASVQYVLDADSTMRAEHAPELARNLFPDPFVNGDPSFFATNNATVGAVVSLNGLPARELIAAADGAFYSGLGGDGGEVRLGMVPGKTYVLSALLDPADAASGAYLEGYTRVAPAGYVQSFQPGSVLMPGDAPARRRISLTIPNGATDAFFRVVGVGLAGQRIRFTDVKLWEVTSPEPASGYNGDSPGCRWLGMPHASPSVKMLPSRDETLVNAPELARNMILNPGPRPGIELIQWFSGYNGAAAMEPQPFSPTGWAIAMPVDITSAAWVRTHEAIRVHPGEQITLAAMTTCVAGDAAALFMNLAAYDGNGVFLGDFSTPGKAVAVESPTMIRGTVTMPAEAVRASLQLRTNGANAGSKFHWWSVQMHSGSALPPYFDGDHQGARWSGVPYESESIKMLPSAADHAMLTWLDAGRAQGKGSPEGVVAAPVGTRYVDTLATNGAVEWTKMSGTDATGWRVTVGDTGWRIVTPENGMTGNLRIRRVADMITIQVAGVNTAAKTADLLLTLPVGFRPMYQAGISRHLVYAAAEDISTQAAIDVQANDPGAGVYLRAASNTTWYGTCHLNSAQAEWPTTLPGTPA